MITIKSKSEIELMRKAGMLVSEMHKFIKPYIKEGISTLELDKLCEDFIKSHDGECSCKGYEGYPATLHYVLVLMIWLFMEFLIIIN